LQEDLQNFVNRAAVESNCDIILADVNHYRVNEIQAADRTLEQIIRFYIEKAKKNNELNLAKTIKPSANIFGMFTLGFHNNHDCRELKKLLSDLGISVNLILPEGGSVTELKNLPQAWFNIVPYREVGLMSAIYLNNELDMPYVSTTPMGIINTATFIREICHIIKTLEVEFLNLNNAKDSAQNVTKVNPNSHRESFNFNFESYIDQQTRFISQAAWFSRSIDCQNLTGKKTVVFGDATHAANITKILVREMGL
jgi:light-independent protochlorophyllide reductase subunit B